MMNRKEYEEYNKKILDMAGEYFYETSMESLCPAKSEKDLVDFWNQKVPQGKIEVDELIGIIKDGFMSGITGIINPRFWGYILTRPVPESHVLDVLVNATHAAPGATHLALSSTLVEKCTFRWFLSEMGLNGFEGLYTNGGSLSILTALKCARDQVVSRKIGISKQVIIYMSEDTHYSVIRAWDILGGGINNVRKFSPDNLGELERNIKKEQKKGNIIVAIICNFGSTNSGEIEPIEKIVSIARRNSIWIHIDASYGGPLLMIEKGKKYREDFQKVDSFNLDLHKWIGMPVGTSIVYLNKKYSYLDSFAFSQKFLDYQNMEYNLNDQCQMGIEGTRRLYGLRVWAALQLTGFDAIKHNIKNTLAVAQYLKKKLSDIDEIEIVKESDLTVILFKIRGYNNDKLRGLAKVLYTENVAFITVSEYKSQPVMRCCISNYNTSEKDVDYVVEYIKKIINLACK